MRLHVGRERRIRRGADVDGARPARGHDADACLLRPRLDPGAGFNQLVQYRIKRAGARARQCHVPSCGRHDRQIGAGFDPVRHDAVGRAMEARHTRNRDPVGAGPVDVGPHCDQAFRQVHHFGLPCSILDQGIAFGKHCSHHQVFGSGHGDEVGDDARSTQLASRRGGLGNNIAMLDVDSGAHQLQSFDVLVHRPGADSAAARQRHAGLAGTCHQRAQHQNRGAHGLDQFVRCDRVVKPGGVKPDGGPVTFDGNAHLFEQLQGSGHIFKRRNVFQHEWLRRQQARTQDREGRILGAGHGNFALERRSAGNYELMHHATLPASASSSTAHGSRCPSGCRAHG